MEQNTDHPHNHIANKEEKHEVKTFISWKAPGRPFRAKGRQFFATVILLVIFVDIILFLFSQYALMVAVVSLAFLSISLSTVPPKDFHYRISSQGIMVEDYFYIWDELYDFYFKNIDGMMTLVVRTRDFLPGELRISLGDVSSEHVRNVLVPFLPYREVVHPTFIEKSSDWLSRNFPLDEK